MNIYPIKFEPIFKQKIWGGSKLISILDKPSKLNQLGESWEISNVKNNISTVKNGAYKGLDLAELMKSFKGQLIGQQNFKKFGIDFPLLIKFLDAKTDLSVQVHPDNEMAKDKHQSYGKTEMWYIIDNDQDASIILGLKNTTKKTEMLSQVNSSNVNTIFNRLKVQKGEAYFIPAGQVHAIGAGVLAAEIQQTSDITYRVYDWDRKDDSGQTRELHTKQAIQATKQFDVGSKVNYSISNNQSNKLIHCDYFKTNIIEVCGHFKKDYGNLDSFIIYMCVEGQAEINVDNSIEPIKMGETVLIPALAKEVIVDSRSCKLLEISIY